MPEANNINPSPAPEPKDVKNSFAKAWSELSAFLFSLIDLNQGLDREGTIVNIKNNKKMEGANAWLLMCSIMIASLGLDLNSPAVIIGAMLISPLMSPILGVGLAVGINDRKTLSISLNHFGIAIAIALVTSTLYFYFSPFKGRETSEIIARTTPTLLDVAVAFFGGIAGIISGSRKDKSNAIPGVAIATALMPPLCVTGFGIANQNWAFTLNSFYLFFMNATFVALATFIIVRFLRFPHKAFSDKSEHRRTQLIIAVFSILMIVPSIYIFSGILRRTNQEYIINQFLDEKFPTAICQLERIQNTDSVDVKVLLGKYLSADSIQALRDELYQKGGRHFYLDFLQDAESRQDIEKLKSTQANFLEVIKNSKEIQHKKDKTIEELQLAIDSLTRQDLLFKHLAMEAKILFPELKAISLANRAMVADLTQGKHSTLPVLYLKWEDKILQNRYKKLLADKEKTLIQWVKIRAALDTLQITH